MGQGRSPLGNVFSTVEWYAVCVGRPTAYGFGLAAPNGTGKEQGHERGDLLALRTDLAPPLSPGCGVLVRTVNQPPS
jgi:hypothetical protein